MSQSLNKLQSNSFDLTILDDLLQPQKVIKEQPNEDQYIVNAKQIDTHTIKRTRVKVTPVVCTVCGFDIANLAYEQNKLSTANYDELPEEIQIVLQQALAKHKQTQHTAADNLIIGASQLKQARKWLSGRQV